MAVCDPGLSDGYACELAYSSVNFEIIIYFVLKKEESIFLNWPESIKFSIFLLISNQEFALPRLFWPLLAYFW